MRRRRHGDVRDAVPVRVADPAGDPAELGAGGVAAPFVDDAHPLLEWPVEVALAREELGKPRVATEPLHLAVADERREIDARGPDLRQPASGIAPASAVGGHQEEQLCRAPPRGGNCQGLLEGFACRVIVPEAAMRLAKEYPRLAVLGRGLHERL